MNEDDIFLEVPRWVWPLAVLALVFTAWAALHIHLGGLVTLPVVAAATVAFGMWLATTYRRPRARRILPHFVALAILLMLQGLEQWSLGYSSVLVEMFPSHFVAPVMWSAGIQLVVFTLLSTTIFLFAGVGIFFHHPLGNYGAWLMMAFAVVGGLWHFLLPVLAGELRYVPGMGMASVVAAWGVLGILRLSAVDTPQGGALVTTLQKLYVALAAVFTATLAFGMAQTAGTMPTIIVCGSMAAGLVAWARTSLRYPTDPRRILPVYLLTAAMLYLHITEEYVYGFGPRIGALVGSGWSEAEFVWTFMFLVPVAWILGALALYFRHPLGGFMSWFIFVGMFLGEPTHLLVFPIAEGGRYHYFPGMWTALLPMVMGIWGLHVVLNDWRGQRESPR